MPVVLHTYVKQMGWNLCLTQDEVGILSTQDLGITSPHAFVNSL